MTQKPANIQDLPAALSAVSSAIHGAQAPAGQALPVNAAPDAGKDKQRKDGYRARARFSVGVLFQHFQRSDHGTEELDVASVITRLKADLLGQKADLSKEEGAKEVACFMETHGQQIFDEMHVLLRGIGVERALPKLVGATVQNLKSGVQWEMSEPITAYACFHQNKHDAMLEHMAQVSRDAPLRHSLSYYLGFMELAPGTRFALLFVHAKGNLFVFLEGPDHWVAAPVAGNEAKFIMGLCYSLSEDERMAWADWHIDMHQQFLLELRKPIEAALGENLSSQKWEAVVEAITMSPTFLNSPLPLVQRYVDEALLEAHTVLQALRRLHNGATKEIKKQREKMQKEQDRKHSRLLKDLDKTNIALKGAVARSQRLSADVTRLTRELAARQNAQTPLSSPDHRANQVRAQLSQFFH